MLPVAHHACTLATGALRSSCTINVSPSGRTHFLAVLGGNAITADSSAASALRFTMLRRINENNAASLIRYTIYWRIVPADGIRKSLAPVRVSALPFSFPERTVSQMLAENRKCF